MIAPILDQKHLLEPRSKPGWHTLLQSPFFECRISLLKQLDYVSSFILSQTLTPNISFTAETVKQGAKATQKLSYGTRTRIQGYWASSKGHFQTKRFLSNTKGLPYQVMY